MLRSTDLGPSARFYNKARLNNVFQIKDTTTGADIDIFNLGSELVIRLEDFDGCMNKDQIKVRFNQLIAKTASLVEALDASSYRQTYREIKGLPL